MACGSAKNNCTHLRITWSLLRSKMMIFGGHVISESSNDLETPGKIKRIKKWVSFIWETFSYFWTCIQSPQSITRIYSDSIDWHQSNFRTIVLFFPSCMVSPVRISLFDNFVWYKNLSHKNVFRLLTCNIGESPTCEPNETLKKWKKTTLNWEQVNRWMCENKGVVFIQDG